MGEGEGETKKEDEGETKKEEEDKGDVKAEKEEPKEEEEEKPPWEEDEEEVKEEKEEPKDEVMGEEKGEKQEPKDEDMADKADAESAEKEEVTKKDEEGEEKADKKEENGSGDKSWEDKSWEDNKSWEDKEKSWEESAEDKPKDEDMEKNADADADTAKKDEDGEKKDTAMDVDKGESKEDGEKTDETEKKDEEMKEASAIAVGDIVEGKFGNGWFEAEVLEISDDKIKVKWKFDDSEEEKAKEDIRAKGAEAAEPEEPEEPEDPAWADSMKFDVGWEDAAWFLEEDSKRLHHLEGLSGADGKVSEKGKCRLRLKEGADASEAGQWAERCLKAMCALRGGTDLELTPMLELAEESYGYAHKAHPLVIISCPPDFQKGALRGKENARAFEMLDELGAVVVFAKKAWEADAAAPAESAEDAEPFSGAVGDEVEAKYGNGWFDATVLEVGDDTVKVKWKHDDSEEEKPKAEVKAKPGAAKEDGAAESSGEAKEDGAAGKAFEVGAEVEGKYGNSWFEATVLEVTDDKVKVKWKFDGSEEEKAKEEIRAKEGAVDEKKEDETKEEEAKEEEEKVVFVEGQEVEAKYQGGDWSPATVVAAGDKTVAVTWKFDGSMAAVPRKDVRAKEGAAAAGEAKAMAVGDKVEGKYGNSWFDATVVEIGSGTIKVKWGFDDSEEEKPTDEVRAKEGEAGASAMAVGDTVEGKFGNSWFEAEVLEIGQGTVKVKWKFDSSEEEKSADEVRAKASEGEKEEAPAEPPPLPVCEEAVLIFGGKDKKSRLKAELRVLNCLEQKAEGHISRRPARNYDEDPECSEANMVIHPLMKDGEFRGRVIGKQGLVRKKIIKVSGCDLELIGKSVFIVGTSEERERAVQLVDEVQKKSFLSGFLKGFDDSACTRMMLPLPAYNSLDKDKKIGEIEDETMTMSFPYMPAGKASSSSEKPVLAEGAVIEGEVKGVWREATILDIYKDDSDDDDGDIVVKLKWTSDEKEALLPAGRLRAKLDGAAAAARKSLEVPYGQRVLLIYGEEADRKRAELKLMANVEAAYPGTYSKESDDRPMVVKKEVTEDEAWKSDAARKQRAGNAAGCHIETIGEALYLVGSKAACNKGLTLVPALIKDTPDGVVGDNCEPSEKHLLPKSKKKNLTADAVAQIEDDTKTFIFFDTGAEEAGLEDELRLVIFGDQAEKAVEEVKRIQEIEQPEPEEWKADDKSWEEDKDKSWEKEEDKSWEKEEDKSWEKEGDKSWEKAEDKSWEKEAWDKKDDSWDKKDDAWNKKDDAWDKKDDSWDKKDDAWNKKEDSWDKKDDAWSKTDSWDKKDEWASSSSDSWGAKKEEASWEKSSWDKKEESWDKKEDSWNKKDDGWGKSDDKWAAADDKWGKSDDKWGKSDDKWAKADDGWGAAEDDKWKSGGQDSWGSSSDAWGAKKEEASWDQKSSWDAKSDAGNSWDRAPAAQSWEQKSWDKKDDWQDKRHGQQDSGQAWDRRGGDSRGQKRSWEDTQPEQSSQPSWTRPAPRGSAIGAPLPSRGDDYSGGARSGGGSKRPSPWESTPTAKRPTFGGGAPSGGAPIGGRGGNAYVSPSGPSRRPATAPSTGAPPWTRREEPGTYEEDPEPALDENPEDEEQAEEMADPEEVLARIDFPTSIQEWDLVQHLVWEGHPALPEGWIRAWSRSNRAEYYVRVADNHSTFNFDDVV